MVAGDDCIPSKTTCIGIMPHIPSKEHCHTLCMDTVDCSVYTYLSGILSCMCILCMSGQDMLGQDRSDQLILDMSVWKICWTKKLFAPKIHGLHSDGRTTKEREREREREREVFINIK